MVIDFSQSTAIVQNCEFKQNIVETSILSTNNGFVTITDSDFTNNIAKRYLPNTTAQTNVMFSNLPRDQKLVHYIKTC